MSEILLELVTPEGTLVSQKIKELTAMTESGEIGILNNHAELKSKLVSAPLKFKTMNDNIDIIAVLGGVIEVTKNKITVLTDFAQRAEDIDEAEAQREADKARAQIQTLSADTKNSNPQLLMAEINLHKQVLKLEASRLVKNMIR
jgi:F-type H+-transporting ATPase subunit epsilon